MAEDTLVVFKLGTVLFRIWILIGLEVDDFCGGVFSGSVHVENYPVHDARAKLVGTRFILEDGEEVFFTPDFRIALRAHEEFVEFWCFKALQDVVEGVALQIVEEIGGGSTEFLQAGGRIALQPFDLLEDCVDLGSEDAGTGA